MVTCDPCKCGIYIIAVFTQFRVRDLKRSMDYVAFLVRAVLHTETTSPAHGKSPSIETRYDFMILMCN